MGMGLLLQVSGDKSKDLTEGVMTVSNVPVHQVDAEIFHWISENFDLLVVLRGKSTRIHPLRIINVCIKFPSSPSNSCYI